MKSQKNPFKVVGYAVIIVLLIFNQSCNNYYKVATAKEVPPVPASIIEANPARFFILRSDTNAYHMNNITLSPDKLSVSCTLDTLTEKHKLHLHHGRGGHMRYKINKPEANVINEVHIYVPKDSTASIGNNYTLALSKVQKIELLEKDKGRSTNSFIIGGLAITAGVIIVVLSIRAALNNVTLYNFTFNFP